MTAESFLEEALAALREQRKHPYGPPVVMGNETERMAGDACIKLCGGDRDKARALWKQIVSLCNGYMPNAACVTLILASDVTNLIPDVEAPEVS